MPERPIIAGYDGSPESRTAVQLGLRLADSAAAPFAVVHAVLDPLHDALATRAGLDLRDHHDALLRRAHADAAAALAGVLAGRERDALVVRLGRAEHVLAEYAREVDASLIVLGGHRRTAAAWLGSGTAAHLLRRADVPVLVTGPGVESVERVLVALDSPEHARDLVAAAQRLAALLGTPLEALHVIDQAILSAVAHRSQYGEDFATVLRRRAEAELWPLIGEGTSRRILAGAVEETLASVVREGPPTLLVLGSHGKGWIDRILLGSTTESLLAALPCSLAVLPVGPHRPEARPPTVRIP